MIYDLRFTIWERTAALLLSGFKFKRKFHVLSYPTQSARGLAQSKTRCVRQCFDSREASWTAAALRRFSTVLNQTRVPVMGNRHKPPLNQ